MHYEFPFVCIILTVKISDVCFCPSEVSSLLSFNVSVLALICILRVNVEPSMYHCRLFMCVVLTLKNIRCVDFAPLMYFRQLFVCIICRPRCVLCIAL